MLRQLRLQNYRCFEDHTVLFNDSTVVVGKNNVGKSTLIEALRLLSLVINRRGGSLVPAPSWTSESPFRLCIAANISDLAFNRDTLFHRYGDPPAQITATFTEGGTVRLHIGREDKIFASIQTEDRWISPFSQFSALKLPPIYILPQVSPLQTNERLLTDSYVEGNLYSHLSSRHFRNQIHRAPASFEDFKRLAEGTWMGLRVEPPERVLQKDGTILSMMVKDGDFVAEVGWMGHGLQMWLQTIWFISRTGTPGVVVLDEPDVYMHPDLQRKLFRLVNSRAEQSLIATHSVEIMAEADPSNILVLDKSKARSSYANSQPALQLLIDNIGGVHNVHLARLWNAKKFLLVEGDDIGLLRHFHAVLYPKAELPLDAVPNLPIDGWGGWAHAVGSSMTLHNAFGDEISTYCILDHDYHTEEEIELRVKEASQRRVELHIWQRKEIENYLLAPAVIQRVIRKRRPEGSIPSIDEIQNQILKFCDSERQNVVYGIAEVLLAQNRGLGIKAHKIAEQRVRALWDDPAKRIALAPGKTILGKLSDWSQATYGVSFGAPAIARHFRVSEINDEIESVLESIETGHGF